MFLALRDLRFAQGRFSLIVTVVALMTLLVGFLTGLTGGLAMQNISALLGMKSDQVVFSVPDGQSTTFEASSVTKDQADAWRDSASGGAANVTPLGIASGLLECGGSSESVVLFGAPQGKADHAPAKNDEVVLGDDTATKLSVAKGDEVTLAGRSLTVADVIPTEYSSHRPVAYLTLDAWHTYRADTRQPEQYATVLLVDGVSNGAAASVNKDQGTTIEDFFPALLKLGSFRSEIGSLGMMIGMLVLISTLVIGVFFLVWSMQRQRDIAVLKAIGARTGYLAKDALGQALLVLIIGAGIGIGLTAGLGYLAAQAMPFIMNAWTLLIPPIGMTLAGLLGALVSLRLITTVDPNQALQASAA